MPARKNAVANVKHCRSLSPSVRPLAVTLAVQAVSRATRVVRFAFPILCLAACRRVIVARPYPAQTGRVPPIVCPLRCRSDRAVEGRNWSPSRSCGAAAMYSRCTHEALTMYSGVGALPLNVVLRLRWHCMPDLVTCWLRRRYGHHPPRRGTVRGRYAPCRCLAVCTMPSGVPRSSGGRICSHDSACCSASGPARAG